MEGIGELASEEEWGAKLRWASRRARSASLFVEKSLRRQVRAAHGRGCAAKTN